MNEKRRKDKGQVYIYIYIIDINHAASSTMSRHIRRRIRSL